MHRFGHSCLSAKTIMYPIQDFCTHSITCCASPAAIHIDALLDHKYVTAGRVCIQAMQDRSNDTYSSVLQYLRLGEIRSALKVCCKIACCARDLQNFMHFRLSTVTTGWRAQCSLFSRILLFQRCSEFRNIQNIT